MRRLGGAVLLLVASAGGVLAQDPLLQWLNGLAQQQLDAREKKVRAITTRAEAERRKEYVRAKVMDSIGGLPEYRGPLRARSMGWIREAEYSIEKVIFESLPGVFVTANVYLPAQTGRRYPAVLAPSGHTQEGKPEPQVLAANLAMQGYVVLTFDPIGQGEREQTYLPQLGRALSGGGGNEHLELGARSRLMGASVARYFIHDAMRGIDYLQSRGDVDPDRIGVVGCSGGGAITAYVAALDPRVKVAAAGCFINSFRTLFTGPTADSEMSLPRFLANGLDWADIFELAAPRPMLMMATEEDYFPPAGARAVYEETRKWYGLYEAGERVRFFVGPGPHGTPRESREEIYNWLDRWLRDGKGDPRDRAVEQFANRELRVTKTGNVDGETGSRKLWEVIRDDFREMRRPGSLAELREELRRWEIAWSGGAPAVEILEKTVVAGHIVERIQFEIEAGVRITGRLHLPTQPGKREAVLVVEDQRLPVPLYVTRSPSTEGIVKEMVDRGQVVLELQVRDSPGELDGRPFLGNWKTNLRADLVGRSLAAMRAKDILAGLEVLAARDEVNPTRIRGFARGVKGYWMLLAAAAGNRLHRVLLDRMPRNLRSVFDQPMSSFLFDGAIPGFALRWDVEDLVALAGKDKFVWSDRVNWMNRVEENEDGVYQRKVGEGDDHVLGKLFAGATGGIP